MWAQAGCGAATGRHDFRQAGVGEVPKLTESRPGGTVAAWLRRKDEEPRLGHPNTSNASRRDSCLQASRSDMLAGTRGARRARHLLERCPRALPSVTVPASCRRSMPGEVGGTRHGASRVRPRGQTAAGLGGERDSWP